MKTQSIKICLTCFAVIASAACLRAAPIIKADNADNLNLTTSWTNGVVPGASDVAVWGSTVTGPNSVALGANATWGGIILTNPGGPVTVAAGNTLTINGGDSRTNGIDMSRASQNLTISSGLVLGPGLQRWSVSNGIALTVDGTFTRSAGATLVKGPGVSQGTVTLSPALVNGVVSWATVQSAGASTNNTANGNNFATVSGGNIIAYTNATPVTNATTSVVLGDIPSGDNSTVNYDLSVTATSTGGSMVSDTYLNTLRKSGAAYNQHGTANLRANGIMNSGTGVLTIGTPIQQADTTLNELVLAAWTSGITLTNTISDNVNPLRITVTGTNSQNIIFAGQSTFSGGITLDAGRAGISVNSIPASGTVTSGPLGTGAVTLNGGILYSTVGGFSIGNPIVVGPAGGSLQYNGASPDLTINGNITGSGTLILNGVYNQNGLFLKGDNTAFNGTVIVSGSNQRLGTSLSGSALAKWVVNGALQASVVGGATYHLGELSSTATTGGLVGWAGNLTPAIQEWVVGELNTSSTYSGIIVNNAAGNAQTGNSDAAANNLVALTKVGTGTLTLSGNNTATGPVRIEQGSLQLGAGGTSGQLSPSATITVNANLTINRSSATVQGTNFSSAPITGEGSFTQAGTGTTILTADNTYSGGTLVSGGTLLVNGSIVGAVTVKSGAKLGGNGTISGVVNVEVGGQLAAGTSIGILTLDSTPVLGGSVVAEISGSTLQSDLITVTGGNPINYGGSLVVSNIGVPLLAGDAFTLFNATTHNGSFASIVGSPGPGLAYTFTNGVLTVVSTAPTEPTSVTTTVATIGNSISGITNTVMIAWPSDYLGWVLQAQTNNVDGSIRTDPAAWFDLPGSGSVSMLNITNPTDMAVYYRMKNFATTLPAGAPTGLTAKPTNSSVALSWTASAYARSYNVKNATVSGGPYDTVANVISTSYTNSGLANGTTYYFVVSALNYNGETADSTEASATPIAIPPLAPTGLIAQAAHGLVSLNWTAPAGVPATSYNVKRGTSTGAYTTITNITVNSLFDTNIVDGTTYYYVVSGLNIDGEGPNSSEVSAMPTATPPAVPVGVTATGQYTQVRVSWTASFGATSYNVKSATAPGGPYTFVANTAATSVYHTGLANDTTYYYVVSALNDISGSTDSSEASATTTTTLPLFYDQEFTGAGFSAPPLPPLGDPSLPFIQSLPDPFAWANDPLNIGGTRSVNSNDWSHHRAEIKAQIENYEIGYKPVVDPSMIFAGVTGSGTTRTLTVRTTNIVNGVARTLTQTATITLPSASGTFPAIMGFNGASGSINLGGRAIATINYQINQVTSYGSQQDANPYYQLYAAPYSPALNSFNTGQYSAWSWGCSRLIDGLYKLNGNLGGGATINLGRIGVTGCSYAGKGALFCGAFDERIALTIAQESGGGGANSWRYNGFVETPGSVEWLPNTDHNWFREDMFAFGASTNAGFLPEDHHQLCAMVAPRALFATGNDGQVWLGTPANVVVCKAVEKIYNTLGISDRFGYNAMGGHGHCATTASIDSEIGAFLDKFLLGQTAVNTIIRDYPTSNGVMVDNYDKIPAANWTAWWGTSTNPYITDMGPTCGTGQAQAPCP